MDTTETYIKMEQGLPNKPIPHTAVAYLAGLIDGEGTVSLRRKIGNHFNIEVYITSSNKPMLEWVQRIFGGKIYTYLRKNDNVRLPQHKWHVHSRDAEALLRLVQPYLIIKGLHAELALRFRENMNRDTSWHREFADRVKVIQKTTTYREPQHQISQDQLQEMLDDRFSNRYPWILAEKFSHFARPSNKVTKSVVWGSMEQLWLAFCMAELHQKKWDGEKWVNADF